MNYFEKYILELLRGHIILNNKEIEIVKNFSNAPELPVITLDLSGGVTTNSIYRDFDTIEEIVFFNRIANININVWSNSEFDQEEICNQILDCFYKEQTNHYIYCSNYDNGTCITGGSCKVPIIINSRSVKNKCPNPELYHYQSLRDKYFIISDQVIIDPPFEMNEYDRTPPLYRSILRARAEYSEPVIKSGLKVEDIILNESDVK